MTGKKVTLALGGGGLKGYAHIGIIAALEENGYEVAGIAGTSAGALFGAFFAFGFSFQEILSFISDLDNSKLFQRVYSEPPSLIGLKGVIEILRAKFGIHTLSQMKIPFAATAVDVNTNQEIYFDIGKIVDALRATIAIPGVFPYFKLDSLTLVDGGIYDPVPVELARHIAGEYPIIAVCLTPPRETIHSMPRSQLPTITPIPASVKDYFAGLKLGKALEVFLNSMDLMQIVMADMQLQLTRPDIILRPDTQNYYFLDEVDPLKLIVNGQKIVEGSLDQIESAVQNFQRVKSELSGIFLSDLHLSLDD